MKYIGLYYGGLFTSSRCVVYSPRDNENTRQWVYEITRTRNNENTW